MAADDAARLREVLQRQWARLYELDAVEAGEEIVRTGYRRLLMSRMAAALSELTDCQAAVVMAQHADDLAILMTCEQRLCTARQRLDRLVAQFADEDQACEQAARCYQADREAVQLAIHRAQLAVSRHDPDT
jgi:hypothetical protein